MLCSFGHNIDQFKSLPTQPCNTKFYPMKHPVQRKEVKLDPTKNALLNLLVTTWIDIHSIQKGIQSTLNPKGQRKPNIHSKAGTKFNSMAN
jgi:hypothetical protein